MHSAGRRSWPWVRETNCNDGGTPRAPHDDDGGGRGGRPCVRGPPSVARRRLLGGLAAAGTRGATRRRVRTRPRATVDRVPLRPPARGAALLRCCARARGRPTAAGRGRRHAIATRWRSLTLSPRGQGAPHTAGVGGLPPARPRVPRGPPPASDHPPRPRPPGLGSGGSGRGVVGWPPARSRRRKAARDIGWGATPACPAAAAQRDSGGGSRGGGPAGQGAASPCGRRGGPPPPPPRDARCGCLVGMPRERQARHCRRDARVAGSATAARLETRGRPRGAGSPARRVRRSGENSRNSSDGFWSPAAGRTPGVAVGRQLEACHHAPLMGSRCNRTAGHNNIKNGQAEQARSHRHRVAGRPAGAWARGVAAPVRPLLRAIGRFNKSERRGSKSLCWGQTDRFETPLTTLLNRPNGWRTARAFQACRHSVEPCFGVAVVVGFLGEQATGGGSASPWAVNGRSELLGPFGGQEWAHLGRSTRPRRRRPENKVAAHAPSPPPTEHRRSGGRDDHRSATGTIRRVHQVEDFILSCLNNYLNLQSL